MGGTDFMLWYGNCIKGSNLGNAIGKASQCRISCIVATHTNSLNRETIT